MNDLYVTADEYVATMHVTEAPADFEELAVLAGGYLDEVTGDYYQLHDIADDSFALRVSRFKRAVMLQIRYMADSGLKTATAYKASLAQSVSQTIGKTAVSKNFGGVTANVSGTIVCDEAYRGLHGTGLLFAGVMHT
jgi:hypothetical protein